MANKSVIEFWVGIFVLAGIVALTMLAFKVGNLGSADIGDSYKVKARFDNIGQLKTKAPVTIAGVRVGRVSNIHVDDNFYALVTLDINKQFNKIPADTGATILTAGLLGEQYIALEPGGDEEFLRDGDELTLTQSALVLEKMIGQFLYSKADEGNTK